MIAAVELKQAFDSGVLDPNRHQRLIEGSSKYCTLAGVPERYLLHGMKSFGCTDNEINLVRRIPKLISDGTGGICYCGEFNTPVEEKFMAVVGACLRNFIDARFMTIYQVMTHLEKRDLPDPTVLVIPNFYMKKGDGGELATWQSGALHGMLLRRLAAQKFTILYVQDMKSMEKDFGSSLHDHIKAQYATYNE